MITLKCNRLFVGLVVFLFIQCDLFRVRRILVKEIKTVWKVFTMHIYFNESLITTTRDSVFKLIEIVNVCVY